MHCLALIGFLIPPPASTIELSPCCYGDRTTSLSADPSSSASHFSASMASLSTIAWLIFGSCAA